MDDVAARHGDWINTYGGRKFWPLDPCVDEIHLTDICHALSLICRYTGHCIGFYSVAEHTYHLYHALKRDGAPQIALDWALVHDAPEAFLSDLSRPLKKGLPDYNKAEDRLMEMIAEKFGLKGSCPKIVKEYDTRILIDEREQNLRPTKDGWHDIIGLDPLGVNIQCWQPIDAERRLLGLCATTFHKETIT